MCRVLGWMLYHGVAGMKFDTVEAWEIKKERMTHLTRKNVILKGFIDTPSTQRTI